MMKHTYGRFCFAVLRFQSYSAEIPIQAVPYIDESDKKINLTQTQCVDRNALDTTKHGLVRILVRA